MTSEQRLDRLERIAKLMASAGLRARRTAREQQEKINIISDAQIKNDERFARIAEAQAENEWRFARNAEAQAENEKRFANVAEAQAENEKRFASMAEAQADNRVLFEKIAEVQVKLAVSQVRTDHRFNTLIDIVREGRNGKSNS